MQNQNQALYAEYEAILVGKKKNFSSSLFPSNNLPAAKENTIETMRFAFEKILHWQPQDIVAGLTPDILKTLRISTLTKYLDMPDDFNAGLHARYIAHLIYPDIIKYNEGDLAIEIYQKVLDGSMKAFPKKYFYGQVGVLRAKACLNYVMREKLTFTSIQEIYEFFLTREGIEKINKLGLGMILTIYETPIDLVHETLAVTQRNEFLRQYCRFRYIYKRVKAAPIEKKTSK